VFQLNTWTEANAPGYSQRIDYRENIDARGNASLPIDRKVT